MPANQKNVKKNLVRDGKLIIIVEQTRVTWYRANFKLKNWVLDKNISVRVLKKYYLPGRNIIRRAKNGSSAFNAGEFVSGFRCKIPMQQTVCGKFN